MSSDVVNYNYFNISILSDFFQCVTLTSQSDVCTLPFAAVLVMKGNGFTHEANKIIVQLDVITKDKKIFKLYSHRRTLSKSRVLFYLVRLVLSR